MSEVVTNPAETYERFMVPTVFRPSAERLVAVAAPQSGERVLDVACGTGIVARQVVARVGPTGQVIGLDLNPHMLEVAQSVAARDGLAIEWQAGQAEALPYPDASFDLVLCQYGLMFFADRQAALSEMARVLRVDGRVALNVWQSLERHPFYQTLDDVIARHLGTSSVGDIFALGNRDELRGLLSAAGLRDVTIEPFSFTARFPDPAGFLAGEIDVDTAAIPAMQHLDPAARRALTAAISDDMTEPLRSVTDGNAVLMPFHALVVHATR